VEGTRRIGYKGGMKRIALLAFALLLVLPGCRRNKNRGPAPAPGTPPPAWLETVVRQQATETDAKAQLISNLYRGYAHDEDEYTQWQVMLETGTCYMFSAAGDQQVEQVYLNLWDPEDDRVAKQKQDGPKGLLQYCAETSGMFKLECKITEGRGHYAVGIFAKGGSAAQPTEAPPEPPDALSDEVEKLAASDAQGAQRVGNFFSGQDAESDWYTALEEDRCYWFVGAGDEGVEQLHLLLWDPKNQPAAENKAGASRVVLGHCPKASGMYRLQAKLGAGKGRYKVGVYAKKK
jgi:hypothetical protein